MKSYALLYSVESLDSGGVLAILCYVVMLRSKYRASARGWQSYSPPGALYFRAIRARARGIPIFGYNPTIRAPCENSTIA